MPGKEALLDARVRSLLLSGLEELVREIVKIDLRLSELDDDENSEVEEIVLTAYRSVLVEEILLIINYLEGDEARLHEASEEKAVAET